MDPYKPPEAELSDQREHALAFDEAIERLLATQSKAGAHIGGILGAITATAMWLGVVIWTGQNNGLFAIVVGMIIGVMVRFNGQVVERSLRFAAAAYALLASFLGGALTGIIPFPLWPLIGAYIAFEISQRALSPEEDRLYWYHRNGIRPWQE